MKIASASIQMQAAHQSSRRIEVSERLEVWGGAADRDGTRTAAAQPAPTSSRVQLSDQALAATQDSQATISGDGSTQDPRLSLLIAMIEAISGRAVKVFDAAAFSRQIDAEPTQLVPPSRTESALPPSGAGFAYERHSLYAEHEQLAFQASGTVRTADGQEIRFEIGFEMQRSHVETSSIGIRGGQPRLQDPLVLDFGGPAGALSDLRFRFDLDADGQEEDVPLLAGGRGFLAFDRNANGRIDDGRELFGPLSGDGFVELAALDSDGNGWLDEADADFSKLSLWQPGADGNGSLLTLAEAGVGAIHLGRVGTPFELRGAANDTLGMMRSTGIYLNENGSVGSISQIDLSV